MLFGDHGVIKKAQTSNEKYKIAKAREKLELVLNTDAALEKRINPKYNQDDFLDKLITSKVTNSKIIDNMVIVDGYVFELDRSVPKIGEYIGKEDNLKYPSLQATATLESDYKSSTITINAEENTNGIKKIEVIQGGFVIKEYTYDNKKEAITENFNVTQNGEYIVKVYSKLPTEQIVEVKGIIMSIEYTPNGNETYKKEHQLIVRAKENGERVKSIKYQWLESTEKPEKETFTEELTNGEQITKNEITGTWYLWTLLETESGSYSIQRSDAFNFDNKGPNVTLTSTPISATSFTLNAEASDEHIGEIAKYEFYVSGQIKGCEEENVEIANCTVSSHTTEGVECYVIVTDLLGNSTTVTTTSKTKLYAWEFYRYENYTYYAKDGIKSKVVKNFREWSGETSLRNSYGFSEERGYYYDGEHRWCQSSAFPIGWYWPESNNLGRFVYRIDERLDGFSENGEYYYSYSCTEFKSSLRDGTRSVGTPVRTETTTSRYTYTNNTIVGGYLCKYVGEK